MVSVVDLESEKYRRILGLGPIQFHRAATYRIFLRVYRGKLSFIEVNNSDDNDAWTRFK